MRARLACEHEHIDWLGPDKRAGLFGYVVWCVECGASAEQFTAAWDDGFRLGFDVTRWGLPEEPVDLVKYPPLDACGAPIRGE
jgi:hypothetical protein